ncbi:DEAD/DEAH box helicase [Pleionea sp. CnH1-48]|uniref:DEAD/DEAH box helicase n=1 Tax=Pleionea sp. CnH1-48 TaxID=2954494 RepID=UPI002098000A|nr:DEAD/DEAH box helicase [Pleionea sp. CnH1-48]MCO7227318.1 DEAD/DEAH box helicase [Pleionea sp. CnH1-48]
MTFASLKLIDPLLQAISEQGYDKPSPIQQEAIPAILAGKDVMAAAQTGTGKTAGFTLPVLQKLSEGDKARSNHVRALILTPTRELAAQVGESVKTYSANMPIRSQVVFGGVKINPQMLRLRKGVDVLVATPGRLMDLFQQNAIKFSQLEFLILDEADRMLDMGFLPDIKKILALLPKTRQSLLFSATFSDDIRTLAKGLLKEPVSIEVSPRNATAQTVKQWLHPVDKKRKAALLSYLIGHHNWEQVLVFVRTKRGANKLAYDLEKNGVQAAAIHGDKSQGTRTRVLKEFKEGKLRALVATDIAARGLDIDQLPQVVNFDLPNVAEDYVHRIGRTGRAGSRGHAISLVSADEVDSLSDIENLIRQKISRKFIDDFIPEHTVPETRLKAQKKKKPHKKKLAKAKERDEKNQTAAPKDRTRGKASRKKPGFITKKKKPTTKRRSQ